MKSKKNHEWQPFVAYDGERYWPMIKKKGWVFTHTLNVSYYPSFYGYAGSAATYSNIPGSSHVSREEAEQGAIRAAREHNTVRSEPVLIPVIEKDSNV